MNRKDFSGWLKHGDFILLDILSLQLGFAIAYWIVHGFGNPYDIDSYQYQGMVLTVSQILIILFTNQYSGIVRRGPFRELWSVLKYMLLTLAIALIYLFITKHSSEASRLQYGLTSLLYVAVAFLLRQLNKKRISLHNSNIRNRRSIVLVTGRELVKDAVAKLNTGSRWQDYFLSGIILLDGREGEVFSFDGSDLSVSRMDPEDSESLAGNASVASECLTGNASAAHTGAATDIVSGVAAGTDADIPTPIETPAPDAAGEAGAASHTIADASAVPQDGSIRSIPVAVMGNQAVEDLIHGWVDEVFLLQPDGVAFPTRFLDSLVQMGIQVSYTMAAVSESDWFATEIGRVGPYKVLTSSVRFISAGQYIVKRLIDIVGGIVGCAITGVLCLFVGPAIYLKSPGPIFFTQERVGQNGKPFRMHKFRSMYLDAEKRKADLMAQNKIADGMMFKMDDDPRIIGSEKKNRKGRPAGIGNFIRNTSIDEFPQFYDVLRGRMSLVGWRPCTMAEWEKYDMQHRIRASMKPGLTGMWQVSGRSNITDFDEVVRLDRYYIENWSLGLDLKILLKTVVIVIRGSGAE